MYFVYILQSARDGSYYTGVTEHLAQRLEEHNAKKSPYSSTKAPWRLAWYCAFSDGEKARAFERYMKSGSGFAFARKRLV